jgi:hypothetical protein
VTKQIFSLLIAVGVLSLALPNVAKAQTNPPVNGTNYQNGVDVTSILEANGE